MMDKLITKQNAVKSGSKKIDAYYTPFEAMPPLVKYIPNNIKTVWEPAAGKGHMLDHLEKLGYYSIGTDIKQGEDFLTYSPNFEWDMIITNPPFSIKDKFISKCYELGKPFALLMPLTALEGKFRQSLYKRYGIEIIVLNKRVNFLMDHTSSKAGCWFASEWFTYGLNIGKQIVFEEM